MQTPHVGIELLSQSHVFQERPAGRWISKNSVSDYREYVVPDGAILVAAQGTMGDNELFGHCQFSHRNFENRMITQHILRVIARSSEDQPWVLVCLLVLRIWLSTPAEHRVWNQVAGVHPPSGRENPCTARQ